MFQEFFQIPGYPGYTPNAVEAFSSVPLEALGQIFGAIALLEYKIADGKYSMMTL